MQADAPATAPASANEPGAGLPIGEAGARRARRLGVYAALLPFFIYVGIFLLLPTLIVAVGAFQDGSGSPTLANIQAIVGERARIDALTRSLQLSVVTALAGAILGALLAWAVAGSKPDGAVRQLTVSISGVLAQFGGVMLAFGFVATFGIEGIVTIVLRGALGGLLDPSIAHGDWVYSQFGLAVVYTYFQIPLMLIVFLPAIDGLRQEWRDASASLGGSSWSYWRHVGGPILAPTFLGAMLLLFTNAFSAYATAAALVSQGSPIITLQIRNALTSEVVLGQENVGKAMALEMIVIVAVVMSLYALLQRRSSRWLR
jgi:putative spermidine/putrescine transport system permease protein